MSVAFPRQGGEERPVVRGVDLRLRRGEMLGVVGESGCGKTLTALAILGLLPPPGRVVSGSVWLGGEELTALPERRLRAVRGRRLAMIFQEPGAALNPVFAVGFQVAEAVRAQRAVGRQEARARAIELLRLVALPDAENRYDAYPHQLSGGQRQRVMIAMALAGEPEVLLADEPTTALDVTVQAQILRLLDRLRQELGLAILLITHDLAVVAQTCERVVVLYAGQVVEEAATEDLFTAPAHPYTRALLAAHPRFEERVPRGELAAIPGRVPAPSNLPTGCAFHPRCSEVLPVCPERPPEVYRVSRPAGSISRRQQLARCFLHDAEGSP